MHTLLPLVLLSGAILSAAAQSASLDDALAGAADYTSGRSREPLRQLELAVASSLSDSTLRAALEAGLGRILTQPASYEARKFACELLAIVGSADAVPALGTLLVDSEQVGIACLALQPNPSAQADQVLRAALSQTEGLARIQIIHTLGERRDPQSVPDLTAQAQSSDPGIAQAAIAALGKIGDEAAHQALANLQRDAPPETARALSEALLRVAERRVAEANLAVARSLYESLLRPSGSASIRRGALTALLALDPDGGTRRILALIKQPDPALLPTALAGVVGLVGADVSRTFGLELPNLTPEFQVLLIQALAGRGDPDARAALASRLGDPAPLVRVAALGALGRIGDASVAPALAAALAGASSPAERSAAQSALAGLPREAAVDQAILAQLEAAPAPAKPALILALGERRARLALPALLARARNADPAVGRAGWQALARLATADDVSAFIEALLDSPLDTRRDDAETAVARALQQIPDAPARSAHLRAALEKTTALEGRCALLRLLPQGADPAALAQLQSATRDPEPRISDTAVRALAQWPDAAAWDLLWQTYTRSENLSHHALALRALVRLAGENNSPPAPEWLARYRALLENARQDADRKVILGALSGVADPIALDLALSQLEYPEVRAEAVAAVKRIAAAIRERHPEAARDALRRVE